MGPQVRRSVHRVDITVSDIIAGSLAICDTLRHVAFAIGVKLYLRHASSPSMFRFLWLFIIRE
jgi:hypothetical protein